MPKNLSFFFMIPFTYLTYYDGRIKFEGMWDLSSLDTGFNRIRKKVNISTVTVYIMVMVTENLRFYVTSF